jgi:hypothetical protein
MLDDDIPRHTTRYRLEDFGDEVVLYDFSTTQLVYLNDTASLIWRLCDGQRNIGAIKTLLQEAFSNDSELIEDDLRTTLKQLVNKEVIELA